MQSESASGAGPGGGTPAAVPMSISMCPSQALREDIDYELVDEDNLSDEQFIEKRKNSIASALKMTPAERKDLAQFFDDIENNLPRAKLYLKYLMGSGRGSGEQRLEHFLSFLKSATQRITMSTKNMLPLYNAIKKEGRGRKSGIDSDSSDAGDEAVFDPELRKERQKRKLFDNARVLQNDCEVPEALALQAEAEKNAKKEKNWRRMVVERAEAYCKERKEYRCIQRVRQFQLPASAATIRKVRKRQEMAASRGMVLGDSATGLDVSKLAERPVITGKGIKPAHTRSIVHPTSALDGVLFFDADEHADGDDGEVVIPARDRDDGDDCLGGLSDALQPRDVPSAVRTSFEAFACPPGNRSESESFKKERALLSSSASSSASAAASLPSAVAISGRSAEADAERATAHRTTVSASGSARQCSIHHVSTSLANNQRQGTARGLASSSSVASVSASSVVEQGSSAPPHSLLFESMPPSSCAVEPDPEARLDQPRMTSFEIPWCGPYRVDLSCLPDEPDAVYRLERTIRLF